jgi:glycosyltransferase involved in cell wall biosynthesis
MSVFFSIVIPTFNRSTDLKRCLDSLINQTYRHFEVLVCDDGSTDNTKQIVDSFQTQLDLKYYWEENWGGPARPRNNGIRYAKGEWICFLDSDDYWYPTKLEACLPYLDESDLVYHHFDVVGEKVPISQNKLFAKKVPKENLFFYLLSNWNPIINSGVVLRKKILDKVGYFDETKSLVGIEDFDLWLRFCEHTNRFTLIPLFLGAYYFTDNSLTKNIISCIDRDLLLLDKHKHKISKKEYNQIKNLINLNAGVRFLSVNDKRMAMGYLKKTLFSEGKLIVKFKALICMLFGDFAFKIQKKINGIINH